MTLALYGHPFSSYTWKGLIALYAGGVEFAFRTLDGDHPGNAQFLAEHGGPWGKFPVLLDGERVILESSSIIEHLALHHAGCAGLIPADGDAAIRMRTLDRIFDNYVMDAMAAVVGEYLRAEGPDQARCAEARARLERSYGWLERWLGDEPPPAGVVTLLECSAAPALFYADWVHPIDERWPRLQAWRATLMELPAVARCVDEARPYRAYFPLGAPDRD